MYIYIRSSNRIALAETPAASTYLSFSCYLEDEGHERNDGGGSNDEADPTSLLCQPHSLFLGIYSPGVKGRPRSGQEALDSAAAAALLGYHRLLSLYFARSLALTPHFQSRVTDRHNQRTDLQTRFGWGVAWMGFASVYVRTRIVRSSLRFASSNGRPDPDLFCMPGRWPRIINQSSECSSNQLNSIDRKMVRMPKLMLALSHFS